MAQLSKDTLKSIFKAGNIPSESDFASLIESNLNLIDTGSLILSASALNISGAVIGKTDIDRLRDGRGLIATSSLVSGSTGDDQDFTSFLRPEAIFSTTDNSTYQKFTIAARVGQFVSGNLFFDQNLSGSNNYIALGKANTADTQFRFSGNITASGNISASGNIITNTITSSHTLITSEHPKLTIKSNTANGDPTLQFKSGDGSTMATIRCDVTNNIMNQLSIGSGTNETHLVLDANGKIGIGLNTPGEQLTVAGNISASGTGSFESIALPGNSTDYYIGGSGGGVATDSLRIGSTTTGNTIAMELFHGTNPVSLGIDYDGGNALAFVDSVHSSFDSVLQFKTGGSERFRIGALDSDTFQIKPAAAANDVEITDNSGAVILYSDTSTKRIGIGTSTPTKALQVTGAISSSGDIKTEGNLEIGANSTNADRTLVIRNTTKTTTISTTPDGDNAKTIMRGGNYTHALQLKDSYNNVGQNEADLYYARLNGGYTHESKLTLFTSQSVGGSSAGATTTIGTATSSLTGNVGIGTTTPSEKLHVAGNITLGNNKRLTFGDSSGNTGTSITYDSNALFKITQANSGELRLNAGFNDNSSNKITFQTRGSLERMRITNDGNVGIGTTTPTGKLHVSGAVANSDFYVSSSGNVGIGTTDPQYAKLQVNGTTLFQGASQIQGDLSLRGNIKD